VQNFTTAKFALRSFSFSFRGRKPFDPPVFISYFLGPKITVGFLVVLGDAGALNPTS
jgi:hypothetical protein